MHQKTCDPKKRTVESQIQNGTKMTCVTKVVWRMFCDEWFSLFCFGCSVRWWRKPCHASHDFCHKSSQFWKKWQKNFEKRKTSFRFNYQTIWSSFCFLTGRSRPTCESLKLIYIVVCHMGCSFFLFCGRPTTTPIKCIHKKRDRCFNAVKTFL